jgi:hypothetical protein
LLHPQTAEQRALTNELLEKFKIDPAFAKKVDQEYGPLDWRLPEAHAIYWAALGLERAEAHSNVVKQTDFDLMQLRRSIFQDMLQAFQYGRLVINPFNHDYALYPNLDIIPTVNATYEKEYAQETNSGQKNGILTAQRNFLRDAVYFLYENGRESQAAKWFNYLCKKFPDKPLLDFDTNSLPSHLTLDQYAVACVQEDIGETSQARVTAAIEGMLARSYANLAIGQSDRAAGFKLLAEKVYQHYGQKIGGHRNPQRIGLPPFNDMNRTVLNQLLDPRQGLPYAARAVLRTQLGLPAETNAPSSVVRSSVSTNAPALTNAPAVQTNGAAAGR